MLLKARWLNYKDKTYVRVLLTCVFSYSLIGSLLLPVLSYQALEIKQHANDFINYATIINILPSLPFLLSVLLAGATNKFNVSSIQFTLLILFIISSLLALVFAKHNLFLLSLYVLAVSLIFRIIYFSLDKQITILLHGKVTSFQSDILILTTVFGVVFTKLSHYLYTEYNEFGVVLVFTIFSSGLFYFIKYIPDVKQSYNATHLSLVVIHRLCESLKLRKLLCNLFLINVIQSPFYLLIFVKFHEINLSTANYSNLLAFAAVFNIIAGVMVKINFLKRYSLHTFLGVCLLAEGICYYVIGYSEQQFIMISVYFVMVLLCGIVNIQNFALIIQTIQTDDYLTKYTSFINGAIATILYLLYLSIELMMNVLLKDITFNNLVMIWGTASVIIISIMWKINKKVPI